MSGNGTMTLLDRSVTVVFTDGARTQLGQGPPAPFVLHVRDPDALRRLLTTPTLLAIGEAFIDGTLDVEGDLLAAMAFAYRLDELTDAPCASSAPTPQDAEAIAHHYDVPVEFYRLFLDPRLVYTCAYYREPGVDLESAQRDKLDLVCQKLQLKPGEDLLDLGCGWGALSIDAAERFGVHSRGITLSVEQAMWAARAASASRAASRIAIEHTDWAGLPDQPLADKIAAVGLVEHVGPARYLGFFERIRRWLRPGGLALVQSITRSAEHAETTGLEFLRRHVFPGGGLATISGLVQAMELAGLEILHVEGLRPHYAQTTRQWVERLQARGTEARAVVGERRYRTWLGYLAAAVVGFEQGDVGVYQVVAGVRPTRSSRVIGGSPPPLSRRLRQVERRRVEGR